MIIKYNVKDCIISNLRISNYGEVVKCYPNRLTRFKENGLTIKMDEKHGDYFLDSEVYVLSSMERSNIPFINFIKVINRELILNKLI